MSQKWNKSETGQDLKQPEKLEFKFEYDPDYHVIPVNGIWGGPTVRGDISAVFFYESQDLPESIVNQITPEGTLGAELQRKGGDKTVLVRHAYIGMMLSAEQAASIGQWLIDKATELRAVKQAKEAKEQASDGVSTTSH